ncbi:MAG: rhomboid family intramembrane serine protease [Candidatus Micrarchaeia archaeon]
MDEYECNIQDNTIYLILLVIIPIFITILFVLPYEIKQLFLLYQNDPTIISIFFSNYLHLTFNHFFTNIISYYIIVVLILKIDDLVRTKKAIIPLFIIVPLVVSLASILLYPKTAYPFLGFSGVVAAFAGYFLTSVWYFLKKIKTDTDIRVLFLLLMLNLTLSTYFNGIKIFSLELWLLLLAITTGLIIYKGSFLLSLYSLFLNYLVNKIRNKNILEVIISGILIFFSVLCLLSFAPLVAISQIETSTNLIGHYFGYVCGLMIGLIVTKSKRLLE